MRELALIAEAKRQLQLATTIGEVKDIRDKAAAIADYLKAAGESLETMTLASEVKLRAEVKAGDLIAEMEKHNGDPRSHDVTRLSDLGITKMQSSRWQKMASIPEAEFDAYVEKVKEEKKELTQAGVLRLAASGKDEKPIPGNQELLEGIRQCVERASSKWTGPRKPAVALLKRLAEEFGSGKKKPENHALMRYPGSKGKLARQIKKHLPTSAYDASEYREPFVGAGAVAVRMMSDILDPKKCPVWLNDLDLGVAGLWRGVHEKPEDLLAMVDSFKPSVQAFTALKTTSDTGDCVLDGFRKLALHQLSFSGIGEMGGPIGGASQDSKYPIDCRWNPKRIRQSVEYIHAMMSRFDITITSLPWEESLNGCGEDGFVYLDPPYYEKGPKLYVKSMSPACHARLAEFLRKKAGFHWLLSYDDHEKVRDLYSWCGMASIDTKYSASVSDGERSAGKELVISPSMSLAA